MANPLQHTLHRLVESRSRTNPAFNQLFDDYRGYHVVLLAFGGLVELLVVAFSVFAWRRAGRRTFEQRAYRGFAWLTTVVALAFAVGLFANLTTVTNPWPGFNLLVNQMADPPPGTQTAKLFTATSDWIESGKSQIPAAVHAAVQHRLSWQRPRAIVCAVLAILFVLIDIALWRHLIERSRTGARQRALTFVGAAAVAVTLVFTMLAVANARGAIQPLSISVLLAGK